MASRLSQKDELEEMLGSDEVYFQPPESVRLRYPAIVYKKNAAKVIHADDIPYHFRERYKITVIDRNPDADWVKKMLDRVKYIYIDTQFTSENLHHFNFTIYY